MCKVSNGLYLIKMLPNSEIEIDEILNTIFPNLNFSEYKKKVELYSKNQIFVLTDLYRICKPQYTNGLVKFFESNIVIGLYENECEHFDIMLKFTTLNFIISEYSDFFEIKNFDFKKHKLSEIELPEIEQRFEPIIAEIDQNFESLFYKPRKIIKKCK